ncbi:hypothetical protein AAFF_G00157310 [Aldrovandia affinis]|uniref:Uncharacterized protein n=1 Tax=Aldrovandia affinis TaxID=143900 RepID=A0AAD7RNB8_9TELE|nr:hypothetical protein AAFF_G00157310 [Aldrovandia affinis]
MREAPPTRYLNILPSAAGAPETPVILANALKVRAKTLERLVLRAQNSQLRKRFTKILTAKLQQLLALPAGTRLDGHRLNFLKRVQEGEERENFAPGTVEGPAASLGHAREARRDCGGSLKGNAAELQQRAPRGRRHAHTGGKGTHHHHHHPQLMRVGCVLGTCQVQNLSHRLYQLIGQSGREDTSPINPKSPHSYG